MDNNHRFIPPAALVTVHKQNKELIFERSEESLPDAMEVARKFYGKSGVHRIKIEVGGAIIFEFKNNVNHMSPDTQNQIKTVQQNRTGNRKRKFY